MLEISCRKCGSGTWRQGSSNKHCYKVEPRCPISTRFSAGSDIMVKHAIDIIPEDKFMRLLCHKKNYTMFFLDSHDEIMRIASEMDCPESDLEIVVLADHLIFSDRENRR
jgi:hypothetical protein